MSTITTTIRMEDSQFFASLNRMESKLSGLATSFGGIASRMASAFLPVATGVGVVTGVMFGLKKSIDAAADMEQLQTSFALLIGSADVAKQTLKDLQTFADNTTFQMPEVADSAKQMIAFGVGAKDVVGTIRMLGDVAVGLKIPLSELTDVYGRNLVQGRLFSRDIYQFQSRGIPIIAALAKQFGVAESSIMGMVEAGKVGSKEMLKAFQDLTGEGGQFNGMLMKQSRTFNGLMSTLADNIGAVFREFGGPLLNVLKPVVDSLILRVKEMIPAARQFGETVARIMSGFQTAFHSGKFSELVGGALELGFARAMNALAGGLETTLAIAGAAFSQLFGDAQFWEGFGKAMVGVASQFGAALLRAFEKPLAYVQAFMEKSFDGSLVADDAELAARKRVGKDVVNPITSGAAYRTNQGTATSADAEIIRRYNEVVAEELAKVLKEREADPKYDTIGQRADRILAEGGVRFGFGGEGMTTGGIAQEGQSMVREGLGLLKKPVVDFLASAKLLAANYQPAALYDEGKLNAIKERLKELFPELPQAGAKGDSANARKGKGPADISGGDYSVVADSLQKIGGGGGVAGVNAVLAEAREQTAQLKTANATLNKMVQVLSFQQNGQPIPVTILR